VLIGHIVFDEFDLARGGFVADLLDLDTQSGGSQVDAVTVSERLLADPESVDTDSVLALEVRNLPTVFGATEPGMRSGDAFVVEDPVAVRRPTDNARRLLDDEDLFFIRLGALVMEEADFFFSIGQIDSLPGLGRCLVCGCCSLHRLCFVPSEEI
jgi:hypothetical protein